jgi:uncharacterized protein YraI
MQPQQFGAPKAEWGIVVLMISLPSMAFTSACVADFSIHSGVSTAPATSSIAPDGDQFRSVPPP